MPIEDKRTKGELQIALFNERQTNVNLYYKIEELTDKLNAMASQQNLYKSTIRAIEMMVGQIAQLSRAGAEQQFVVAKDGR